MIPKIIHYCWFGGGEIPEKDKKCIESWKKYCPDYEIIDWNESNYDVKKNKYMYDAYKAKKWGFVPDYARFDIVFTYGGIYMDTDVEVMKSLESLLDNSGYMGFEEGNFVNGGIGFGAEKGNNVMRNLRDMYENLQFLKPNGEINTLPSPYYITDYLVSEGLKRNNKIQNISDIVVYPREYFAPKEFSTGNISLTENTYTIHHYNASWLDEKTKKRLVRSQKVNSTFGKGFGGIINWFLDKLCKVIDIIKKN